MASSVLETITGSAATTTNTPTCGELGLLHEEEAAIWTDLSVEAPTEVGLPRLTVFDL